MGVVHCVTRMAPVWHFRFKTTHVMSLTPLSSTKIYPPSAALGVTVYSDPYYTLEPGLWGYGACGADAGTI